MTILASSILDRVELQLGDITNVRWSRAELLSWLSIGCRLVTTLQPSATNSVAVTKLVAGTRQYIPADGWLLLDILRNMGTSGTTAGRAVRVTSRRILDAFNPLWHTDSPSSTIQHYIFDPQDQTSYFVYPPADGTSYLEVNYSAIPAPLTSESQTLGVPDAYEDALHNYVMFRALSKNTDYAASSQADMYLGMFNTILGAKMTAEQANNPNIGLAPPNPQSGGVS